MVQESNVRGGCQGSLWEGVSLVERVMGGSQVPLHGAAEGSKTPRKGIPLMVREKEVP